MEVIKILEKAKKLGVFLKLKGDNLVLKSTKKNIDPDFLKILKEEKINIINHLKIYSRDRSAIISSEEKIKIYNRDQYEHIPLSFSQERLWFMDQLQGSLEYHLPFAFRLSGDLNKKALFKSLQEVVKRHEVLRTVLYAEEGIGYQKFLSEDNWELSSKDLSKDGSLLSEDLKSFLSAPFDLSADYMFRSCLYDLGNKEYVLAGAFHHISSDGWSQGILIKEFSSLYSSYALDKEFNLPSLPLQYTDYALWQRNYLEGTVIDNQLSYWEDKLKGVNKLQLPTDYVRPAVQSISGASISFKLSTTLRTGIKTLSKQEGVTVFMTLLAVFKVLLNRYSGQEDICVGTPVANRTQKELEGMIGFFVNTLALRSNINNDISFKELLQEVKQTTLDAYDHQQIPFEKIVERVVKTRDMSMSPLFQVLFVLQNTPDSENIELDGLTLSNYETEGQVTSKFDMTMTLKETETDFSVHINYCTALFNEETIQRMFVHYEKLLESVIKSPSEKLSNLSILSKEEANQLLEVFNDTAVAYPKDKTILDLFEEQVKTVPNAIAVVFEGEELSYTELDEKSNQLARYLINKGIKPATLVGICIDRSLEMLIGILGILKSGSAYVPIDPTYPQERIDYMLEDSGVQVVLSAHTCATTFTDKDTLDIVLLDTDWGTIAEESIEELNRIVTPENLAYVIYTSGSTGNPKGVMNAHKGILNRLLWTQETYGLVASEDVILQKTTFCFDVSVWELLWGLISGCKLVFARPGGQGDALYLKELIEKEKVTTLHFVPSMLGVFLEEVSIGDCSSLRTVLCSGEALSLEQVRLFRKVFPEVRFDNLYGPTEAAIDVSSWSVPEDVSSLVNIPIGSPVSNTSLYVLDVNEKLVPLGVIGELCIGGAQVAVGYLNREALTNEKFVENPFKEGERMYKTGDLARWLPDGNIEFIGRKDNQVKIRGYRIELGEIEHVLTELPDVKQAAVLAKSDAVGANTLIGYVVVEGNFNKEALQEQLKQSLPEYMVPQLWVELDEMPLTANGKLDRKALPDVDNSTLSTKEYVAPRTEVEIQLVTIWQDLLEVEKVGIYDNFFELGGHSLLVVRLISKIQTIGYTISIRDIFSHPNIVLLSTKLVLASSSYKVPENGIIEGCDYITPSMVPLVNLNQEELTIIMNQVPGGGTNIQDVYPLSPLQEGIYFHHLMSDRNNGDPYVLPNLLSFSSISKRIEFIEALNFIVSRHDVLRTCILNSELSEVVQVVLREATLPVEVLSIDKTQEISFQVKKEIASSNLWIDPSKAPMLRLKIADDVANETYYLVLNYHHLIMDHIGLEKVQQEVVLYLSGKKDQLPTPTLYRNFIGDTLNKEKLEESKTYFSSLYLNIEEPTYPFNLVGNQVNGSTTILSSKTILSPVLRNAIRNFSSKLQVSPAVLFHAAFGLVVGRCSNTDYALFGSLFLGRLQGAKGSESSLGLFINTLPVLLDLKGDIGTYIAHTNKRLQDLLSYEQTPLSNIHDLSAISNDVPMFSALLNYRHSSSGASSENTFDTGAKFMSGGSRNNYPFNFDVDDYGNDFGLTAKISDNGINPSNVISYMEEALTVLLEALDKESIIDVNELSILPKEEEQQLLEVFNATDISLNSKESTVVDLFEEQAIKNPKEVALVYEGATLSYKELEERSNQLAHYLIEKGVKANNLIGICIDKSLNMLVGILGILKSGGAYVPIDPTYPQTRIDYMLEDSGVNILLSDEKNSISFSNKDHLDIILLDTDSDTIAKESTERINRIASPENLAYVIYTSGSTGQPKGVLIAHQSLTDYFYGITAKTNILDCNSFGLASSIATDLGNTVIYTSLLIGGSLHILSEDELVSSEKLSKLSIDCLKMVPSHWKTLQQKEHVFVPNKCLILGGEQFTDAVFNLLDSENVSCEVYNHYGPTETTIGKLIHKVSFTEELEDSVPLGVPFGNTEVYVLDAHHKINPIGVVGELCISGSGLAVGYLNQETLTEEKFIKNPFKAEERLYKTGDLARWLPNGKIEFIGRKDNQIKIRGYRIELGEIENVLSLVPGVTHSCVLAKDDDNGSKRLIGYVVLEGNLDKEALQETLKLSLPEYMIPMIWVKLAEMPLTNNGKIDRQSLPEPDSSGLSTKAYVAPRTETEEQLAVIWQDLLKIEKVGIHDNFFELGGQSLMAIRLIARLKKIGYTVNIRDFYSDPVIASLSTKLASVSTAYKVPENGIKGGCEYIIPAMVSLVDLKQEELETIMDQVPGGSENIQDIYPLSPLQEGIYFHHLMSDQGYGDPYIVSSLLSFSSLKKRTDFIEALVFVIGRHDVFRTGIVSSGLSKTVQVVLREVDLPVEELSIDKNEEILGQIEKELTPDKISMDLTQAPMLQVKVTDDVTNGAYYLVLNHHHLMTDAVGMAKVREEIMFYLSGKAGLLPKPALYRDFIGDTLNKEKLAESKKYFNSLFEGIEEPTYPFNLSDTKVDGGTTIGYSKAMLSPALGEAVRKVSSNLQVSPAVLFHAAFGLVVGRCSDTEYALFGSALLGRLQGAKGSEASLGLFINTLPVLLDLKGDLSAYIAHTNKRLQELFSYEQTPLTNVHQWSGISNDVPMFSALINYRHSKSESSSEKGFDLGAKLLSEEKERTNYPFNLDVNDHGDSFGLTAKISGSDALASTVISYMEQALTGLLNDIEEENILSVDELSILPKEEKNQLLHVFNDTTVEYPKDKTIIDLYEKQVKENPNATAVVYDGKELSYKELEERSNQLAHYLVTKDIKTATLIGICIDRSLEMLVGILGILKSGNAYVPIDPAYPKDRMDYILNDSGATMLLCDRKSATIFSDKDHLDIILLDADLDKISKESTKQLNNLTTPESLAYVIYTSGSTGKPKGVPIAHASLLNFLLGMVDRLEMKDLEVFLSVTTYTFDIFYLELFAPLILGAKVIVLDNASIRDGEKLEYAIARYRPDFMQATPSIWQMLIDNGWGNKENITVLTGGEAINESLKDSLTMISDTVWNLYGPTEATIWVTTKKLKHSEKVTIGEAINNVQLYVLNSSHNIVPIGVLGELCIGGVQISKGYLNREALTEEKFIKSPFKEGERIYKTGDLARWLPDGSIDLVGRKDNQVKIRGYRIELGEIESVLTQVATVNQAIVLAREDARGNKRLVGYVVLEGDLDKEALQVALKQSLPEYMIPQLWVTLEEMPLTSNGKLNRKALPDIDSATLSTKEYVAPRTELEEQLAAIWQDLLGVEKVGVYDNFFELGGHSLLATRLVSTVVKELEVDIMIKDIFNFVNIDELSAYLEYKKVKEKESSDTVYKKTIKI